MKPFTAGPLTFSSLTARLDRYGFWSRPTLDLAVARNAIEAVKTLAFEAKQGTETPRILHGVIKSVVDASAYYSLVERVCSHGPVMAHLRELWPDILLNKPQPSFNNQLKTLKLLQSQSQPIGYKAIAAVLRSQCSHKRFIEATNLIELLPRRSLFKVLGVPIVLTSCASASLGIWAQAPFIAAGLAVFWLGLALNSLRIPNYGNVYWNTRYNRLEQLQLTDRLRLASSLVTAYEEYGPVNVTNYHWRHRELRSRPPGIEAQNELESETEHIEKHLIISLRNLGIETRKSEHPVNLYADYWSEEYSRWHSVEWHDPDQDPAEIIESSHRTTTQSN